MFDTISLIIKDTKQKRKDKNYFGIILNAEAVLEYLPQIIEYEVDSEHAYRKFEAELSEKRDEFDKRYSGSYCETKAKATDFYKEYRKAQLFRELMYEVIQISKKLAGSLDQEFKASSNK